MPSEARSDDAAADADSRRHTDERIYVEIVDAIFDQRIQPGTKLSEAKLGDIYNVSRTVVRKALFRLTSEKLVAMRPNRGATVAQPTIEEARQVFEARCVVEAAIVETCTPRIDESARCRLEALIAADREAHQQSDRRAAIRASGDFHHALADIAGNDVLTSFLDELIGRSSLIIAMNSEWGTIPCSHEAHTKLLDVLMSGDVDAASRAMTAHLRDRLALLHLRDQNSHGDLHGILQGSS